MGSFFSKADRKIVPLDTRQTASAPAQLEGLEGTTIIKNEARVAGISDSGLGITTPQSSPLQGRGAALHQAQAEFKSTPSSEAGPLSPTKRGPKKIDVLGDQSDGKKLAADLPAAVSIPEDGQQWAMVFGEVVVRNFHSSDWKDREQSLASIQRSISSSKFLAGKDPQAVYLTTAEMLARTLKDKVAPIFHASLALVTELLAAFSSLLPQPVLHRGMDQILPLIIHRCGNLNTRIHESSLQAVLTIANTQGLGSSYVGPFALAEPPKRNRDASQAAQMYGRLDLVHSLLVASRCTQGLPLEAVLKLSKQGLEMPDEKVRQAAIKVVVQLYRLQRAAGLDLPVEKHLGLMKPALMQMLQKKFAEVDGGGIGGGDEAGIGAAAMATGIKVYGKSLPPLQHTGSMPAAPGPAPLSPLRARPPRTAGGPPPSPGPAGRPTFSRDRARMGSPASTSKPAAGSLTPKSPGKSVVAQPDLASELQVPQYSQMQVSVSSPSGRAAGKARSVVQGATALDAAEEQLIQYIMTDQDQQAMRL